MPETLKIAISGASGFVGARLAQELELQGHSVSRIVRKTESLKPKELAWIPDRGLLHPEALEGFDAIFHLAGRSIASGRWSAAEKERIRSSRVEATARIVDQLLKLEAPPPLFISASAVGLYGDCGSELIEESHPPGKDFLADVAKDWEAAAEPLVASGIRVVHARLGIVMDKAGGALAKMLPLFRWGIAGRLGSGEQYMSWIALADVIRGLCWLLETETARGAYNFVSPEPLKNSDFTSQLANALARPAILPVPAFALRLAMGEMADALLLSSCRAIPARLEAESFSFRFRSFGGFLEDQFNN